MDKKFLSPTQLADRWGVTTSALQNYRRTKNSGRASGPVYTKIGGKILYELFEVEKYEENCKVGNLKGAE